MLAHNRLSELHLKCHVYRPLDRPPLVRPRDESQEAFDAVVEHEAEARTATVSAKRRYRAKKPTP